MELTDAVLLSNRMSALDEFAAHDAMRPTR